MKRCGLLALFVLLGVPRVFATATAVQLSVNESRQIQILGVTAAWAIDTNVVDASAVNGGVALHGRAAGHTRVIVTGVTGENTLDVIVTSKDSATKKAAALAPSQTVADVRYSSATREVQNSVTMTRVEPDRRTQLDVRSVHRIGGDALGNRAATSLPHVSYGIFTGKREVTFFDRDVLHSPLTLYGTPLRGIHYLDEHWRLHAGYTAYAMYQSFFVPVDRELVAGAAYAFRTSAHTTFTPGVFAYPGEGSVISLLGDYAKDDTALRAELGISNGIGGAVQFSIDNAKDQARVDVRYRPQGFAIVGPGDLHGLRADANWNHAYGHGSSAAVSFAAADLGGNNGRVFAANFDVDQRLTNVVSLLGGASWGSFNGVNSFTVPVGVDLRFARGGITALYRYAQSGTNRGGHGARLAGRMSLGHFFVSGYADRQQNAPTLDVIFGEQPELELALRELGISATSPSDVVRALRENAILAELGFIEGVTVDFAPMRTQVGFEAAWLGGGPSRQQLRARMLHNINEGVASRTETTIASLTYARRITDATDLFAGYTFWRTARRGFAANVQPYVEVGVRQRFDGVPSFSRSNGTITGVVFADEDLDGTSDGTGVVVEVELDGTKQQTSEDGKFSFRNVTRGSHRVTARVPSPEAYFTTPSRVEAQPGDRVEFGIATMPARVFGQVTNDAGRGIADVRVLLSRGSRQVFATTDSEGKFTAATAPGEWELSIVADSVPSGHSLSDAAARTVTLHRNEPNRVAWQLRALRSVTGSGAPANAEITIEPLGKRVRTDAEGRFSVRSLPAGDVTLVAGNVKRTVTLSPDPSSVTVDFGAIAPPPAVRTVVSGERRDTLHYVQIGTYRVRVNAEETLERARRSGVDARLHVSGPYTIVSAGPYPSSSAAHDDATRLLRAGLEAVVTSPK